MVTGMYVAKSFIGSSFTPGEVIPDDIPTEKLEWWKKAGAIEEIKPAVFTGDQSEREGESVEADQNYAEPEEQETDSFSEIEPEAPEVDVSTALVQEPDNAEKQEQAKEKKKGKKGAKAK